MQKKNPRIRFQKQRAHQLQAHVQTVIQSSALGNVSVAEFYSVKQGTHFK